MATSVTAATARAGWRRPRRALILTARLALIVSPLLLWQLGADHGIIDVSFFSKPSAIWSYLEQWWSGGGSIHSSLGQDLQATLIVFGLGYVIGVTAGVALGILIGTVRIAREILDPYIAAVNAVPKLILMPMLLVVFGFGYVPQIVLVVSVIVLFAAINIASGVAETARHLVSNCRILGASRMQLIRYVYLPSLSIWILGTSRVSVGYAVQASIAAQLVGGNKGLGFRIVDASSTFQSDEMFAAFTVLVVLVLIVDYLLSLVERRVHRWMPLNSAG